MNNLHTHYDTLMVSRNASQEVIRAAFKSLCQKYHPDRNTHPDADRILQQFNESYTLLSDPIARSRYDRLLAEYDYSRTENRSGREKKVVIINIPDSISLSGTKEKLRNFTPNISESTRSELKASLDMIAKILIFVVIALIIFIVFILIFKY